ncbi:hypothetical protein RHSIM_Rhsim07G0156400 [Rhododendron simsii]|uniref:No apical meristem-associated C-terminal domain-containing protein n=1 Tax=Rhododendron simsii TaxID=118357 RepID=A0A834GS52_RHOSS|nr:hypothetical protein RHSIM_Rhsim07G0156400 [Rhododendron simsii]
MDSLQDPFFSNLIHDGSNLGNQFMESQYVSEVGQVAQKVSQFSVKIEPVVRKRGGNFSIEEDNMLECEKKKPKRGRTVATPLAELANPEEDVADDIIEVERPIGSKIAKEQRKKNKTNDPASAPIVQVLNELKEDKKAANEKKHQMLQISYGLQAEKLKMEQLKEEARIMMLDTSGMPPMQQEYIHQRQMEIDDASMCMNARMLLYYERPDAYVLLIRSLCNMIMTFCIVSVVHPTATEPLLVANIKGPVTRHDMTVMLTAASPMAAVVHYIGILEGGLQVTKEDT